MDSDQLYSIYYTPKKAFLQWGCNAMTNEELVAMIQAGERDKLMELWANVEKLVRNNAYRWDRAFRGRNGATLGDYMQAGFIGFLHSVDYYRPDRGASFTTTLVMCIKRPFMHTAGVVSKVNDPLRRPISLDVPVTKDEDSAPLGHFIEDPQGEAAFLEVEAQQLRDALDAALATLTEDEKKVIWARYWRGLTQGQTGQRYGMSLAAASRIEHSALRKLRSPAVSQELRQLWRCS